MKKWLVLSLVLGLAPGALALTETFNYADQAAFAAVWNGNATAPGTLPYALDLTVGNPLPSYGMFAPTANSTATRAALNLGGNFDGTDATPLEFSLDFQLELGGVGTFWSGARQYIELRGYDGGGYGLGTLTNLIALGAYNNSDDSAFSTQKYQARALGTPDIPATDWATLTAAPSRSDGWHNLKVVIDSNSFDFYVDGTLGKSVARGTIAPFNCIVLGSGYTSAGFDAWADNVTLVNTPEPTTLALLVMGGLALARRRR